MSAAPDPGPPPATLMKELLRAQDGGDVMAAVAACDQLLQDHPAFMPAQRWKLEHLIEAGQLQEALVRSREIQRQFPPMRAMAVTKQAVALDRLKQPGAALRVLLELHGDGEANAPASVLLGQLLFRDGSLDRAEALFREIRAQDRLHPAAMRGLIDIAIKRGTGAVGLALCDEAETLKALPDDAVQIRRAQCLDLLGEGAQARALLADLSEAGQATAQSQMTHARLLWKTGDLEAAQRAFAAVPAEAPEHSAALEGQVTVLSELGAFDAAIAVCDAAIAAHTPAAPGSDALHLRRAQTLLAAGRAADAVTALERILENAEPTGALHLELANAYVQAGLLDKAHAAFETGLGFEKTRVAALLGQVEIARLRGCHGYAVDLLRTAIAFHEGVDPTLHLALCEALIRADASGGIEPLLHQVIDSAVSLDDIQIEHMFTLAERQTLPAITSHLIQIVTGRAALSAQVARRLLKMAHITADQNVLRQVANALGAKLPAAQRTDFQIEATALVDGPDAALLLARRVLVNRAAPSSVMIIGRYLAEAGQIGLALRYLRRAVRRLPEHRGLNALYVHICGVAGHYAAGHVHLDAMIAKAPDLDIERERLMLMFSKGATPELLERAALRRDSGLPGLHPRQFLDLCLACGDLDRALATQHEIRSDPVSSSRMAAYFSTGLSGRMLTDLQIYSALEAKQLQQGKSREAIEAALAAQYYYPAKRVLERWVATTKPPQDGRDAPIPKRIFQYWDSAAVPDDVAALVASWKAVPEFEHVLLDRTSAMALLRRQFGRPLVTAFQRARHVTEESDLLRLCLIYKFGGIYSDADDRAVGDIAALAGLGSGLVLTREPIGALANNTLIAPPGNPILKIALKMTVEALHARDADGAWFKSGPGMLTRAAAVYLRDADPQEARAHLTVLAGDTLRRFIQPHIPLPYKKTVKYWNTQDKDVSQQVLASLVRLAQKTG